MEAAQTIEEIEREEHQIRSALLFKFDTIALRSRHDPEVNNNAINFKIDELIHYREQVIAKLRINHKDRYWIDLLIAVNNELRICLGL